MAKVLLINPVHAPTRGPFPSIGLAYIAAALKAEGADVECLDLNRHRPVLSLAEVEKQIAQRDFDIAAIGAMITAYKHVKQLCETIKRLRSDSELWVGGSIVSPIPELMLGDVPWVDVGVLGEGDETVGELYRATVARGDLSQVAGIVFRNDGVLCRTPERRRISNLDTLPLPDWEIFQLRGQGGYFTTHEWPLRIVTHRGCPFECTFCYHERGSRTHSVERVLTELRRGVEALGAPALTMADDLFCTNRAWVQELCRQMIDLDLNIKWSATGRANVIDRETLRLMKAAGCESVGMGFESASPKILRNIRKRVSPRQMSDALKMCREEGIRPKLSFMIGNEGEDLGTIAESVEFMKRELITSVMFFATPYPSTPLYESARARGLIEDEVGLFSRYGEQGDDLAVNVTDFADNELIWLQKTAMRDVRRHYDKEHYKRIARERIGPEAKSVAVVASGYEGENMVVAYRPLFETLVLFVEHPVDGPAHYRGVPVRPLGALAASEFDAVVVADRTISPATHELLTRQAALDKMVHPYDDEYHFFKSL